MSPWGVSPIGKSEPEARFFFQKGYTDYTHKSKYDDY